MKEEVLLSIEIDRGDAEKQVDSLTKKIVELTTANKNLAAQNKDLEKTGQQNSQQYIENSKQIEINKQKITEASASRKNLISTIIAEDNSIKALNVRNGELIKQRNLISTATEAGRAKIAEINREIDANNKVIKENVSAQEKQRLGVGGYVDALDKLVPGLGATVTGIQNATKAALVFIATPLGLVIAAIGAAIFALTSYFKSSETAQNQFNKIMAVGSAILEQFMNVVEGVGEAIFNAISNPKQALIDFGNLLKDQIVNRFTGFLELIPAVGRAIGLLFKGEFAAAGKVAFDAVAKVTLGVENASDKINGMIQGIGALVTEGIKYGQLIADLNAKIDKDERKLIVDRAQIALDVSKKRAEAVEQEGEVRRKTIQEAIKLEEDLAAREVALRRERLALAKAELQANGDDKDALNKVAEAQAAVISAQAAAFDNTLRFRKQLEALDDEEAKKTAFYNAEYKKQQDEAAAEELDRQQRIRDALNETQEMRLQQAVDNAANLEERINAEIELETFKTLTLLENEKLLDEERQQILEQGQISINEIIKKGNDDKNKAILEADKKMALEKKKLRDQEVSGINASLDAGVALAKAAFGENKAIAIAETVINTVRGIVRAIADYPFPYSVIMGALVGALGTAQTAKIAGITFARGGMLRRDISKRGGMLRGRDHSRGGIPFSVAGQQGFEAEGGEAIINKRSSKMFRNELSAINQAGGGVAFATGGIIGASQTRQASTQAQNQTSVRDAVITAYQNLPPIIVSVEDINARAEEVSTNAQKAIIA